MSGLAPRIDNIESEANVAYLRPNANLIINGNFDFWQRGTSLVVPAYTRAFLADRWFDYVQISTSTASRQSFTIGQTDVPNNPTYFHRSVVVTGGTANSQVQFFHLFEDLTKYSEKTVTLSFYAKADSNKNIAIETRKDYGSGGSPAETGINVKKVAITSSWQKITYTFTVPSNSGKTIGVGGYFGVSLWFDSGSDFNARNESLGNQSGTFDIAQVKLEEGPVATPFVLAGGTLEGELLINGLVDTINIVTGSSTIIQTNPNYIINGNFDFWQRGTSLADGGGIRYLADRFRTLASGSTLALSRQTFTVGQTDVPHNPTYFHRAVVSSVTGAAHRVDIQYWVEDVKPLAGKTATLSFWIKADSNKNMSIEGSQIFGTGGSPSANVSLGGEKFAITSSWQKITKTFTVTSIAGKTLGTNNDSSLLFLFWLDAGSDYNARTDSLGHQSGTFDIAQVKLEEGSVATPFVLAGGNIAGELAACQRYYEKSFPLDIAPANNTGLYTHIYTQIKHGYGMKVTVPFSVLKRKVPTPVVYNPVATTANRAVFIATGDALTHASLASFANSLHLTIYGGVGDETGYPIAFNWAADAELN